MKILALNSSPRAAGQSKSELLLIHLVRGMQEAGAEVETVNLRQKKINYCLGCYTCWTKTPGVCVHKDDMTLELMPKWLKSDIAVYSFPLYHYTVNAQMKAFIERTLPVLMPYFEPSDDHTTHPLRSKPPASVVLSVAGFPDESVFSALSVWARKVFSRSLLAEIYRPAAEFMVHSMTVEDILDAMEQAGRELVMQKAISDETMQRIKRPIADANILTAVANSSWQTVIDQKMTVAEAERKGFGPRPNSIEAMMGFLLFGFNPRKAEGKKGILQFNISGEKSGDFYFVINGEECTAHAGCAEKADCTVASPFEVWSDIIQGKAEGAKMFMEGKCTAKGDLPLMMVFGKS